MSDEALVQKGFVVSGRVQGVFFRAWTQSLALELGLQGMVRNRRDGSVETHVSGSPEAVEAFETRLWEGPPSASVRDVEVLDADQTLASGHFQIMATV